MKRGKTLWKTLVSASAVLTLAAGAFTPALAEDTTADTATSDTAVIPVAGFTKTYTEVSALSTTDAPSPAETFTYTIAKLKEVKNSEYNLVTDAPKEVQQISIGTDAKGKNNVTFDKGAATTKGATADISIRADIANYKKPGIYYYEFNENTGDTAGVTYSTDKYRVMLPVVYDKDNATLKFDTDNIHVIRATVAEDKSISYPYESGSKTKLANKVNTIENQYRAGGLQIKKFVTGNLGDKDKAFTITVTLNAPTDKLVKSDMKLKVTNAPVQNSVKVDRAKDGLSADKDGAYTIAGDGWTTKTIEFQVKNGSEYYLVNIPDGVKYTVSESVADGYEATFTDGSKDISTGITNGNVTMTEATTMDATLQTVIIANRKDTTLDTGVFLNNMPYIALVAVAAAALVFFLKNQKHQEQE